MSDVQLMGLPQSNFVWAVRIALAEKGAPYEHVPVPPHSPEATAVHPLGKIPVLRHGTVAIGESRAIIDYIDRTFEGSRLVPEDQGDLLRSDTWTSIITSSIEPLLVRRYVLAYLNPTGANGEPDRTQIDQLLPQVEAQLDILEAAIASGDVGGGPFGRVDAYLVPILFYVRTFPEGGSMIAARPRLASYLERGLSRPSVLTSMPGSSQ
jgi:glutathione S-transferase